MTMRLGAFLLLLTGCIVSPVLGEDPIFYVAGAFQKTGMFSLPQDRELTISKAIAMAGGLREDARPSDCVLVRLHEDGRRKEQQINLEAVLQGKEPDSPIHHNDVLFIPSRATGPKDDTVEPPWIREPFDDLEGPSDEVIDPPWLKRAEL